MAFPKFYWLRQNDKGEFFYFIKWPNILYAKNFALSRKTIFPYV